MFCSRCGTEVDNKSKFCPSCGLDLATTTPLAAVGADDTGEVTEFGKVRDALQEEYKIIAELGRGGMAIVYRAREIALDRDVAVKVLPFSLAFDKEFVERFQREAKTAGKLEHPNIIPIYRVGKKDRVIYFVMKYLRGQSLSDILEQKGAMPPGEIRRLLIQTVGALGYAHRHGIVHRDVKPDNIMFDESRHAVVTDFGIAKAATGTRLTGTGMSIGTPHYMSPEQARAQSLDGRSDIYSLGVVAYQCFTGGVPFDGEDAFSIGYKHIMEEIPVPQLASPEHREMFHIIHRMMAKSPEDRYQSAEELVAALEGVGAPTPSVSVSASELPTTVMQSAPGTPSQAIPSGAHPGTPTTPIPKVVPEAKPKEKKRSGVFVGMLLLLLVGGGGAGGYWFFVLNPSTTSTPTLNPVTPADSLRLGLVDSVGAIDSVPPQGEDSAVAVGPSVTDLPNTGTLVLVGVSSRATVKLDGEETADSVITVQPGSIKIDVTRTGFEPFSETAAVARGDTVTVSITMKRIQQVQRPQPPPQPVVSCSEPGNNYNTDGSCFDVAPRVSQACLLPRPQGTEGQLIAVLWVQVLGDGTYGQISRQRQSTSAAFNIAALRFARGVAYTPARKGGQAVDAWLRLLCRAR